MTNKTVWGLLFLSSVSMGLGPAKDNWPTTKVNFAFAKKNFINNNNCYKRFENFFGCIIGFNRFYENENLKESKKLFPNSMLRHSVEAGDVITEFSGFALAKVAVPQIARMSAKEIKTLLAKERSLSIQGWKELFNGKEGPDFDALLDALQETHKKNPKNPWMASLILNGFLSVADGPHSTLLPKPDAREIGLSLMATPPDKPKEIKKGPTATLRIDTFLNPGSYAILERTLHEYKKKNVSGIILDLRANPGGDASLALQVLSLFYPKNTTLVATHKVLRSNDPAVFVPLLDLGSYFLPTATLAQKADALEVPKWFETTTWRDGMYDGPLTVLIDEESASASELVASAVQEVKVNGKPRGVVVGVRSFGKGTAQSPEEWAFDSNVVFLRTKFFFTTPEGYSPHIDGVNPDIYAGVNPFANESNQVLLREEDMYDWNLSFPQVKRTGEPSEFVKEIQTCVAKKGQAKEKFKRLGFLPNFDYQTAVAIDTLNCL